MARYKEESEIPDYDADIITGSKRMADIFEQTVALGAAPKEGIKLADDRNDASFKRADDGSG